MFDFRLKVFYTVARRLNFTRAAEELFITQPAVSKHIKEIEAHYTCKLFNRTGTKIQLTGAGKILLNHTEALFETYRKLEVELLSLNNKHKGIVRIGASTTASQYILPKSLAIFRHRLPGVSVEFLSGNSEHIENLLLENKIDLGIVEGKSKRSHIKYVPFLKDEMVLCTSSSNPFQKSILPLHQLKTLPLIIREQGSGSLEVMVAALKKAKIKLSDLQVEMTLESIESIKSYLLHSHSFAFISLHAILNELKANTLKIIDVEGLAIERYFYYITQQGDNNPLSELFIKGVSDNNFKL